MEMEALRLQNEELKAEVGRLKVAQRAMAVAATDRRRADEKKRSSLVSESGRPG